MKQSTNISDEKLLCHKVPWFNANLVGEFRQGYLNNHFQDKICDGINLSLYSVAKD